jgi:hypothetical protein
METKQLSPAVRDSGIYVQQSICKYVAHLTKEKVFIEKAFYRRENLLTLRIKPVLYNQRYQRTANY